MGYDHSEYDPKPFGKFKTYCPACLRVVRCGNPDGEPIYYRHWLDPDVPRGERDRCMNSRQAVSKAYFVSDNGLLVSRATYELSKGPR